MINKYILAIEKIAGKLNEPTHDIHASSPSQKLRPRAEIIIFNETGVYAIKKGDYLLMPGGGIDDGETPVMGARREAMEEADRLPKNIEPRQTVSAVYDKDNILMPGWDGEKSHFFIGVDGGPARMNHKDKEPFKIIPFDECIEYLNALIDNPKQLWAKKNNEIRKSLIKEVKRLSKTKGNMVFKKYAFYLPLWRNDGK